MTKQVQRQESTKRPNMSKYNFDQIHLCIPRSVSDSNFLIGTQLNLQTSTNHELKPNAVAWRLSPHQRGVRQWNAITWIVHWMLQDFASIKIQVGHSVHRTSTIYSIRVLHICWNAWISEQWYAMLNSWVCMMMYGCILGKFRLISLPRANLYPFHQPCKSTWNTSTSLRLSLLSEIFRFLQVLFRGTSCAWPAVSDVPWSMENGVRSAVPLPEIEEKTRSIILARKDLSPGVLGHKLQVFLGGCQETQASTANTKQSLGRVQLNRSSWFGWLLVPFNGHAKKSWWDWTSNRVTHCCLGSTKSFGGGDMW